ncbi:hypothetical protein CRE_30399 [Caenorhabditis remanei]|uniref:Serine/threonine specific protein phosphatases domain-containing protein n=1 Tax=Caenorhabditis remanei TaxID=31234 RepID=E3NAF8_CAERE|nr:hypothetical protein CRE_30399 [Caenorhabditis remanei]
MPLACSIGEKILTMHGGISRKLENWKSFDTVSKQRTSTRTYLFFKFFANKKLLTIFSAPRYMDETDNRGAIVRIREDGNFGIIIFNNTKGGKLVFPTAHTSHYQKYFAEPIYMNILLQQWQVAQEDDRSIGVNGLDQLCRQKHMQSDQEASF